MNPEFQRNLWLELTPRRLVLMVAVLGLVFFASTLSGSLGLGPASLAPWLYYLIVVVWGSRNAALSVVGEIRDRTWDLQRLSSLGPGALTWGKLFGATIYNWAGGGVCLVVILADHALLKGAGIALIDLIYYLAIGIIAQAAALLASLIAIRRRQAHSRLEIFLYQLAGLLAAACVYWIWERADLGGSLFGHVTPTDFILWWGNAVDARAFLLVSLALFAGWTFVGCYRQMRLELQMRNGPLVWIGFLVFIGLYVAGFDAWLSRDTTVVGWDTAALRLGLACSAFVALTYIMVFLEPKDRVHYRWLGNELGKGRFGGAVSGLQAWMTAYGAAALVTLTLCVWLLSGSHAEGAALSAAMMGFLTRDTAIFVLAQALSGPRRGDLAAVAVIFTLYVLMPEIVNGLGLKATLVFFYPHPGGLVWLSPLVAWVEGIGLAAIAITRIALSEGEARAAATAS